MYSCTHKFVHTHTEKEKKITFNTYIYTSVELILNKIILESDLKYINIILKDKKIMENKKEKVKKKTMAILT